MRSISASALRPKSSQESRGEEFPFPVDPDVQDVFLIEFKFDPGSAVGNDFCQDKGPSCIGFKEHAGRPMQLADDHALGAVDDKRSVFGHERDVAEVDFLLFDIANALPFRFGVLIPDDQPHRHLQRNGKRHASFLAFFHGVFDAQFHRAAAKFASRIFDFVLCAAMPAAAAFRIIGAVDDRFAAFGAVGAEVIQPFQVAAFALPVPDGVFDELQGGSAAKIVDGKNRVENGLQSHIFPFRWRNIHLQKAMVRFSLNFDQIRNGNAGMDFGKIHAIPIHIRSADVGH